MLAEPLLNTPFKPKTYEAFSEQDLSGSAAFRPFRLQLIPQFTKWRRSQEPKKAAIYRSQEAALLHTLLHITPLFVGITLVVLNVKTSFIGSISSNGLTAIQFASKLLEVLIQASIASIVLAFVRNKILSKVGLPFGGFTIPFRTTDISSLWSLELWGCLTSTSSNLMTRSIICIFFANAIILAALIGPSSAVLMIPRPVSHLGDSYINLYVGSADISPSSIGLLGENLSAEPDFNASYFQLRAEFEEQWPIRITDSYGTRSFQVAVDLNYNHVATVPTVLSSKNLRASPSMSITNRMTQPYVYFDCEDPMHSVNVTDPAHQYVEFGRNKSFLGNMLTFDKLMPDFTRATDDVSIDSLSFLIKGIDKPWQKNGTIVWSTPPAGVTNTSLVTVFSSGSPPYDELSIQACSIHAYWATVTTNISSDNRISNEFPANIDDDLLTVLSQLEDKKVIALSPVWAKRSVIVSTAVTNYSDPYQAWHLQGFSHALALSYVPQADNYRNVLYLNRYTQTDAQSLGITDQQHNVLFTYMNKNELFSKYNEIDVYMKSKDWTDQDAFVQSELRVYYLGYGYDSSTITVKLSLAVMIFYLIATMGYLLHTMVTGKVGHSWDSVAELIALALNSRRPENLENTSVGIDTLETFRRPVNIRVNEDESLEIVFDAADHRKGYTDVVPNGEY